MYFRSHWKYFVVATLTLTSSNAFAAKSFAPSNFMPQNDRYLYDRLDRGNMTKAEFETAVKTTTDSFKDIIAAHGGVLSVVTDWEDPTVNAYADQQGKDWQVHFYGGLAREAAMTLDGMALVVCHELGHHLGGFPYFSDPTGNWAAVEGQADYFATQACAKRVWKTDTRNNAKARKTVTADVQAKCDAAYKKKGDQNLCYRTAQAALALTTVLADTGAAPKYGTPDTQVVTTTNEDHPEAQCRLDTMVHGAICPVKFDFTTIPGKANVSGQASMDAQKDAFIYSCSATSQNPLETAGARPACWFKQL